MMRQVLIVSLLATVAGCFILRDADARDRPYQVLKGQIAIVEGAPTLADISRKVGHLLRTFSGVTVPPFTRSAAPRAIIRVRARLV